MDTGLTNLLFLMAAVSPMRNLLKSRLGPFLEVTRDFLRCRLGPVPGFLKGRLELAVFLKGRFGAQLPMPGSGIPFTLQRYWSVRERARSATFRRRIWLNRRSEERRVGKECRSRW